MKKKYIFCILILFLIFILVISNYRKILTRYYDKKYLDYENIITVTDMKTYLVQFKNLKNKVLLMEYGLEKGGIAKIEEEIYEPVKSEYISKRYIDFNEFNEILEDVSKICEKELKLDENNRIKYGGEFIIVKTKDLNKILVNSF